MSDRIDFAGRTAVITGAASGIGEALAEGLAHRGCNLALADIDEDGLHRVKARLNRQGLRTTATTLDVADENAIAHFVTFVEREHSGAHLLFNNAGVALGGEFERISSEDFDWLMSINFWGVVRMTRAFLPILKRSDRAHIVNISSIFGVIAPYGQTAYSASKFAVRGFSDALRHELADSSIGVTTVHPGGVATKIADSARAPADVSAQEVEKVREISRKLLTMPPPKAAQIILRGVERGKKRVFVGRDAKTAALLERLFPASYWSILSRFVAPQE